MLPKHWGGAATGSALSKHLQDKRAAHSRLLSLISQAGIPSRLPASALNLTLEAGQLLAAVAAVREAESLAHQTGERREHGAGLLPDLGANAELLGQAIDLAGQSVQQKVSCRLVCSCAAGVVSEPAIPLPKSIWSLKRWQTFFINLDVSGCLNGRSSLWL